MSLFTCTLLLILVNGDVDQSHCDDIPEAYLTEIDVLSFIEGSIDTKLQIAKQFDDAFHTLGAVRIINHGIPHELMVELLNKTAEFFDESLDLKMKFENKINASNILDWYGFIPVGDEAVDSYKSDQDTNLEFKPDAVESLHIASNYPDTLEMQKGNAFRPTPNELPSYLGDIMSMYWQQTRQLIFNIHWIASMALGFDVTQNIFEPNMTSNSFIDIRLANYPALELETMPKYRFNPHQDITGFTLITNDNVDGLQVSVNDSNGNIVWYKITPKLGGIIVLGGEFIERWTNGYWISSYHAVGSVPDRRVSMITFVSPDLDTIVDILPCEKCMGGERKFEPIAGCDLFEQRVSGSYSYEAK